MYNSEYVIDDENVIELLKFSGTWNLDILAKLHVCVTYMNNNITINNACRLYNYILENFDNHKSHIVNEFYVFIHVNLYLPVSCTNHCVYIDTC